MLKSSREIEHVSDLLSSLDEASLFATNQLELPFCNADLESLVRLNILTDLSNGAAHCPCLRKQGIVEYGVLVAWNPDHPSAEDLLSGIDGRNGMALPVGDINDGWIVFTIDRYLPLCPQRRSRRKKKRSLPRSYQTRQRPNPNQVANCINFLRVCTSKKSSSGATCWRELIGHIAPPASYSIQVREYSMISEC
jgi:hypothetical protein